MATNKNATARYGWIDDCLRRQHRQWTIEALMEFIRAKQREFGVGSNTGISKRQVQEDIKHMRPGGMTGYEAPIECDRENGSYYYADPSYSIRNSPFFSEDAAVLRQALAALQQFQDFGLGKELSELVSRVEKHLRDHHTGEDEPPVIWFEQVADYAGTAFLAPLYRAIRARQVLLLHYRPFGAAAALVETIHPHFLKEFNRRWFLLAASDARPGVSHFALDRIEQAVAEPAIAYQPATSSPDAYFRDVIGVSVPAETNVMEVRLLFSQGRGQYVRTKPLHPSQQIAHETAEDLEVTLQLKPNRELDTLLLSFGDAVEVLAPAALRARITARLREAAARYQS